MFSAKYENKKKSYQIVLIYVIKNIEAIYTSCKNITDNAKS